MRGFLGRLFGSPKALADTAGTVVKALDGFVYTKQERAENDARTVTEARQMVIKWMETSQGQNLSRRLIALSITLVWLLLFVAGGAMAIAALWMNQEPVVVDGVAYLSDFEKCKAASDILDEKADIMSGAVMLILGFYFAATHVSTIVGSAMHKFSGKKNVS